MGKKSANFLFARCILIRRNSSRAFLQMSIGKFFLPYSQLFLVEFFLPCALRFYFMIFLGFNYWLPAVPLLLYFLFYRRIIKIGFVRDKMAHLCSRNSFQCVALQRAFLQFYLRHLQWLLKVLARYSYYIIYILINQVQEI